MVYLLSIDITSTTCFSNLISKAFPFVTRYLSTDTWWTLLLITHISCVRYQIDQLQNSGLFSCIGWHLSCLSVNILVAILIEYGRVLSLARVSQHTDQHVMADLCQDLFKTRPRLDQDLFKTQPTLDQNSDRYVDWQSTQMSADVSVNTLYKTHDPKKSVGQ